MLKQVAVILSVVAAMASAQSQTCVKPPTIPELDVVEYLGDWYEVLGLPSWFSPSGSSCIAAGYGDNGDGTISVWNRQKYPNAEYGEICGYAYQPDPANAPGELTVVFGPGANPGDDERQDEPPSNYWIIGYEPGQWSAVYSCFDVENANTTTVVSEYGWVLTRENEPSQEVINAALLAFTDNGINVEGFEPIPQGDLGQCGNYFPPDGSPNCFGEMPPPPEEQ